MPGNFRIRAECSFSSLMLPITNSCMIFPEFLRLNLMVSLCLTENSECVRCVFVTRVSRQGQGGVVRLNLVRAQRIKLLNLICFLDIFS